MSFYALDNALLPSRHISADARATALTKSIYADDSSRSFFSSAALQLALLFHAAADGILRRGA